MVGVEDVWEKLRESVVVMEKEARGGVVEGRDNDGDVDDDEEEEEEEEDEGRYNTLGTSNRGVCFLAGVGRTRRDRRTELRIDGI
jgi:hypothetical protein